MPVPYVQIQVAADSSQQPDLQQWSPWLLQQTLWPERCGQLQGGDTRPCCSMLLLHHTIALPVLSCAMDIAVQFIPCVLNIA